jgi:hypothetical protein
MMSQICLKIKNILASSHHVFVVWFCTRLEIVKNLVLHGYERMLGICIWVLQWIVTWPWGTSPVAKLWECQWLGHKAGPPWPSHSLFQIFLNDESNMLKNEKRVGVFPSRVCCLVLYKIGNCEKACVTWL